MCRQSQNWVERVGLRVYERAGVQNELWPSETTSAEVSDGILRLFRVVPLVERGHRLSTCVGGRGGGEERRRERRDTEVEAWREGNGGGVEEGSSAVLGACRTCWERRKQGRWGSEAEECSAEWSLRTPPTIKLLASLSMPGDLTNIRSPFQDATHILTGELSPVRRASVTVTMSKVIIIALRRPLLDHDWWSLTSVVGSKSL
ncbi:hypothetical protein F5148DRAFT_1371926 [Russula earlei]|uniref:Uncharacterized protein n=1 Tax=Russula earlei TaxID=71964 RepID=A0ACC0TRL1_9AGAM|nr:hypothetical protein F5148DRAFT_1371926 [Russula earlei]